jgi:hypothetical protein
MVLLRYLIIYISYRFQEGKDTDIFEDEQEKPQKTPSIRESDDRRERIDAFLLRFFVFSMKKVSICFADSDFCCNFAAKIGNS